MLSYREMLEGLQARRQFMIDHQLTSKANWQHMIQLMEIEKAIEYYTRKAEEEEQICEY